MADPLPSPSEASPWQVTGEEARELMRLHREQLRSYDTVPAEPPEKGAKAKKYEPSELSLDDVDEDVRKLVAQYALSHPGVDIEPLRYITIGGSEAATVVGAEELADERMVTFVVTETIADDERAEVRSRVLVARATASKSS
jgi:hypothetical protein